MTNSERDAETAERETRAGCRCTPCTCKTCGC